MRRIHSLVDPALEALAESLTDDIPQIRLAAAKDILDRAGYKPSEKLTLGGDIENPLTVQHVSAGEELLGRIARIRARRNLKEGDSRPVPGQTESPTV